MRTGWNRDLLTRRIDRCYLIATWTRAAEKRDYYLALARQYRAMLASLPAAHRFAPRAITA